MADIDELDVSFEQAMALPHMRESIEYSVNSILDELMEPGEGAIEAGAEHEWSGGYDRQTSHDIGAYVEYKEGLKYMCWNAGNAVAALEVWQAILTHIKDER